MAIDVSNNNGVIDWAKVAKEGTKYAAIKAAEGMYEIDSAFHYNALAAMKHGLVISPYFYGHPSEDPKLQARHFIEVAHYYLRAGIGRPWLDLEVAEAESDAYLQAWAKAWFSVVDPIVRCKSMLYSYSGFVGRFGSALIDHPLAIANFDGIPSAQVFVGAWKRKRVYVHQYSETGKIPGIHGNVDLDYRFVPLFTIKNPRIFRKA